MVEYDAAMERVGWWGACALPQNPSWQGRGESEGPLQPTTNAGGGEETVLL